MTAEVAKFYMTDWWSFCDFHVTFLMLVNKFPLMGRDCLFFILFSVTHTKHRNPLLSFTSLLQLQV